MIKTTSLLAIIATVALITPAFAMDGNRGMPCANEEGLSKIECRIDMVQERIALMEKRHQANNDENTPQEILDLQQLQKDRANKVNELLEESKLSENSQERKELIKKMSVPLKALEEGCDKLHELWHKHRGF